MTIDPKRPPYSIGDPIELQVDHLDASGAGVGAVGPHEVRVDGFIPGDRGEATVTHVARQRGLVFATAGSISEPGPGRRLAPCEHHGRCHGCPWMHLDEAHQWKEKQRHLATLGFDDVTIHQPPGPPPALPVPEAFHPEAPGVEPRSSGGEPTEPYNPHFGYRYSSKRVVGGRPGLLVFGSYRRRSHELAAMDACLVDHPDLAAAAREIKQQARNLKIQAFDDKLKKGDLRYVWLKTNGLGEVMVTLITAKRGSRVRELANNLKRPSTIAWAVQTSRSNAMKGELLEILRGPETMAMTLCDTTFQVGPLGFLQPNPRAIEPAYRALVGDAAGKLAFDLYAGAGVTTKLLRAKFERVNPCESNEESAALLKVAAQTTAEFLRDQLKDPEKCPERIVANPPRSGFDVETREALKVFAERAKRQDKALSLGIMSCNPETLARDIADLKSAGFNMVSVDGYDTLPQTSHIELVAQLKLVPGA